MPSRRVPLITDQIYHIFNKSIDRKPIFVHKKPIKRAYDTLYFYRFKNIPTRLSYFLHWSKEKQDQFIEKIEKQHTTLVEIICYCLMPNHFHLMLKQKEEHGISKFLSQFQNSFTRYFNTFTNRKGHLFLGQFKCVRIETKEQLLHVSRYIHLNPYSSYVVKNLDTLHKYEPSSLLEYINKQRGFCHTDFILSFFENAKKYQEFVYNHSDYQRKLEHIKHLTIEKD